MKIAINTLGPSKLKAGIGNYVVNLVHELARIDGRNEYLILANEDNAQHFRFRNKNFTTFVLPSYTKNRVLRILWEQIRLPKFLKKHNVNILHSPGFVAPLRKTTKSVVTVHDMTFFSHPEHHTRWKQMYFRRMIPKSVEKADAVIADSENTKQEIIRYLKTDKNKITTVHLGVGKHFKTGDKKPAQQFLRKKYHIKHNFILFVGTIEPRKNLTRLVEAFLYVKNKGLKLVIVGEKGWKMDSFFKMIDELELKEEVIFTGYVQDTDLVRFYQAAEIFVYPSLYEGFGIPVIEAMACGCPVLTSNISSLKEIAERSAILVNPTYTKAITKAIQKLLKDSPQKRALIHEGIIRAQHLTWEKTAKKTLEVYQKVL